MENTTRRLRVLWASWTYGCLATQGGNLNKRSHQLRVRILLDIILWWREWSWRCTWGSRSSFRSWSPGTGSHKRMRVQAKSMGEFTKFRVLSNASITAWLGSCSPETGSAKNWGWGQRWFWCQAGQFIQTRNRLCFRSKERATTRLKEDEPKPCKPSRGIFDC